MIYPADAGRRIRWRKVFLTMPRHVPRIGEGATTRYSPPLHEGCVNPRARAVEFNDDTVILRSQA